MSRSRSALIPTTLAAALLAAAAPLHADTPPDVLAFPAVNLGADSPAHVGDFDGDGHADLVAAAGMHLLVFLGDGLGGFGPAVPSADFPPEIGDLEVADFDGDGLSDVAFGQGDSSQVRVLRGAGGGALEPLAVLPLTDQGFVRDVELADMDGDGLPDVLASQSDVWRLTLHLNAGSGAFVQPSLDTPSIPEPPRIEAADVNGDGHADIVERGFGFPTDPLAVVFAKGGGTFEQPQTIAQLASYNVLALGDLSGDGVADIVTVDDFSSALTVRAWVPGTGFAPPVAVPLAASHARALVIADLNRDGVLDAVVAHGAGALSLVLQQPDGALGPAVRAGTGLGPVAVEAADLDEDGGIDLVVSNPMTTGGACILRGDGHGQSPTMSATQYGSYDHALADVDADGTPDVVASIGSPNVFLIRGLAGGGLAPATTIDVGAVGAGRVLAFDASGDGLVDVVSGGYAAVSLAPGLGDGTFGAPLLTDVPGDAIAIDAHDLDGDGQLDLVALVRAFDTSEPATVLLLRSTGGPFGLLGSVTVSSTALAIVAGDMDEDGTPDLVVNDGETNDVQVLLDSGAGYVPAGTAALDLNDYFGFDLQDVDMDGHLDAFGPAGGDRVRIALGTGAGTFQGISDFAFDAPTTGAVLADFDGDGVPDLAASMYDSPSHRQLGVRSGLGAGAFGSLVAGPVGSDAYGLRAADMDGDGVSDVVVRLSYIAVAQVLSERGPWQDLGHSLAGRAGFSGLQGIGPLTAGSTVTLRAEHGLPGAPALLVVGASEALQPFKGGILVPAPDVVAFVGTLDADGDLQLAGSLPASLPGGTTFSMQIWRPEPSAPQGFAATHAVRGVTR